MSPQLNFTGAAEGQVPKTALSAIAVVMGKKDMDPMEVAGHIGKAVRDNSAHPTTWLMATMRIAHGGVDLNTIPEEKLEGLTPYQPKGLFVDDDEVPENANRGPAVVPS